MTVTPTYVFDVEVKMLKLHTRIKLNKLRSSYIDTKSQNFRIVRRLSAGTSRNSRWFGNLELTRYNWYSTRKVDNGKRWTPMWTNRCRLSTQQISGCQV